MLLERKTLLAEFKVDAVKREVEMYASTFGNVDHGRDRVVKGAFTKTIRDKYPIGGIKVRRNHDGAVGKPIHMEQDSKGLLTISRISKTPLGDETLCLVEDGVINRGSIGYRIDGADGKRYVTENDVKIRELLQLDLDEYSLLDMPPMNDEAAVVGVKSIYDAMCVLDQMQSGIYALSRLASLPPEITARIAALIKDLESLPNEDPAELAEATAQINSLSGLFTQFAASLRTANT